MRQTVTSLVRQYGQTYTIRKATEGAGANAWTQGALTPSYSACLGKQRHYKPDEIVGAILEHDVLIVLEVQGLLVVPAAGDRIAIGTWAADDTGAEWLQVVNVYAAHAAGQVAAYRLQARR